MPTTTKTKRPALKKSLKPATRRVSSKLSSSSFRAPAATASPWHYETEVTKQQTISEEKTESIFVDPEQQFSVDSPRKTWTDHTLVLLVFLFPFIVFPWTFSPHEFPKQLFLGLCVVVGASILLIETRKTTKCTIIPRHLSVLFGLGAFITASISAIRSGLHYQSLLGQGGTESLSVLGLFLLGIWVLISYNLRSRARLLVRAIIASGTVLSGITILSLLNISLYRFAGAGFNPTGTTTTSGIIAGTTLVLIAGRLLARPLIKEKILLCIASLCPLVLLFGIGFRVPFIVVAVGLGILTIDTFARPDHSLFKRVLPIAIGTILALIFAVYPVTHFLTTPLEISPSHKETWSIVRHTIQESPLLGSGPASFSADYLRFRSLPILQTPFWNIAFDWGSSTLLTFVATLGILGSMLLVLAVASILIVHAYKALKTSASRDSTLLAAGVALFVAAALSPTPFSLLFFFATILGLILGESATSLCIQKHPALAHLARIPVLILVVVFLVLQGLRASAEMLAVRGVTASTKDASASLKMLTLANTINPYVDSYHRITSDLNRALLQNTLADPAITKDNEQGLQTVRDAVSRTLNEAKRATELAPNNVTNWLTLGSVYLEIAPFTSGVASMAIDALTKANELSPSDPSILVNLGIAKTLAARAEDQVANKDNAVLLANSAEEFLRKAVQIRPNLPFAHLELARLFAQQGKIEEAITSYRSAQSLVPSDPALHYEIGLFLLQNKNTDDARKELEQAVQLAENFSNARWYLAQAYEELGETQKAIEQIEEIIKLNPENQQAKDRLAELQKKVE